MLVACRRIIAYLLVGVLLMLVVSYGICLRSELYTATPTVPISSYPPMLAGRAPLGPRTCGWAHAGFGKRLWNYADAGGFSPKGEPYPPYEGTAELIELGWPWYAFEGGRYIIDGARFEVGATTSGRGLGWNNPGTTFVPIRPAILGFTLNTAFFAMLVAIPMEALRAIRRRRRSFLGRCPDCGHELNSATRCPECGRPSANAATHETRTSRDELPNERCS